MRSGVVEVDKLFLRGLVMVQSKIVLVMASSASG